MLSKMGKKGARVSEENLRREKLRVPEKPHDVIITGNHPAFIEGVPVDRILLPESPIVGVRIFNRLRSKQVLIDGEHTPFSYWKSSPQAVLVIQPWRRVAHASPPGAPRSCTP
jgi:hypothetical protein